MKTHSVTVRYKLVNLFKIVPRVLKGLYKGLLWLRPVTGFIVPMFFLAVVYFYGFIGISIKGDYACNYRDFFGTYGAPLYRQNCPMFRFRQLPIFPWQ